MRRAIEKDPDALTNTSTAAQFSGLRTLTLAGNSITAEGLLNLEELGSDKYRPSWPSMEYIRIENVILSRRTAEFLADQKVNLSIRNAVRVEGAFGAFQSGSRLRCAQLSGIHIIPLRIENEIEFYVIDTIWLAGTKGSAKICAENYVTRTIAVARQPSQDCRRISPEGVEAYRGNSPMTNANMWAKGHIVACSAIHGLHYSSPVDIQGMDTSVRAG